MLPRSVRFFALAAALFACGPPPTPIAALTDGGSTDPVIRRVAVGAEKSGAAVRLLWVDGDDGSRTRLDVPLFASRLSGEYDLPILCSWERPALSSDRVLCVPSWPSAIRETGQPLYATAGCKEAERLVFEPAASRACAGGHASFAVVARADATLCQTAIVVWDVQQIPTPAQTYAMREGACRMVGAGNPALIYYRTGRELGASELPQGQLGAE